MLLYYISGRTHLADLPQHGASAADALIRSFEMAAEAGVDLIQLREKDLPIRELEQLAIRATRAIRRQSRSTRFLINSRIDVAVSAGADGVHLRSEDIDAGTARSILLEAGLKNPVIGVSCHTPQQAALAWSQGADFAVFGPVFEKDGQHYSNGLDRLAAACRAANGMPVLALGGIACDNADQCLAAGAAGVAGIRLFQNGNVASVVTRLRSLGAERA